jgi:hypothetical protein
MYLILTLVSLVTMVNASGIMMGGGSCDTSEEAEYSKLSNTKNDPTSGIFCQRFCVSTYDSSKSITSTPRCFLDSSEKDGVRRKINAILRGVRSESDIQKAIKTVREAKDLDQAAKNLENQFAQSTCENVRDDLAVAQKTYDAVNLALKCSAGANNSKSGSIKK